MSELKPCPFCGGKAEIDFSSVGEYGNRSHQSGSVTCKNRDCDAEICIHDFDPDDSSVNPTKILTDKWNARTDGWISVEDELPEVGIKVLCYRPEAEKSADEIIKVSYVLDGKNRSPQGVEHKFECWCHVSHWMPLPQPPKVTK